MCSVSNVPKSLGSSAVIVVLAAKLHYFWPSLATAKTNCTVLRSLFRTLYIFLALTPRKNVCMYTADTIYTAGAHSTKGIKLWSIGRKPKCVIFTFYNARPY